MVETVEHRMPYAKKLHSFMCEVEILYCYLKHNSDLSSYNRMWIQESYSYLEFRGSTIEQKVENIMFELGSLQVVMSYDTLNYINFIEEKMGKPSSRKRLCQAVKTILGL